MLLIQFGLLLKYRDLTDINAVTTLDANKNPLKKAFVVSKENNSTIVPQDWLGTTTWPPFHCFLYISMADVTL